jgi:hypothetical protein
MASQIETFMFFDNSGWSKSFPTQLDSAQTLILVFGASNYLDCPEPIEELVRAFPKSHILGCSTSGEIHGASLYDQSLSVAIVSFQTTTLKNISVSLDTKNNVDAFKVGRSIAEQLTLEAECKLQGILLFSDGLLVNGSELIAGLNSILPPSVIISGGLAGDGTAFKQTWTIHSGLPQSGKISAVGLYGDNLHIQHGCQGGWDIFGPEREVTRSQGNVLFELDGKPALELYKKYLGTQAHGLPATALHFPLSLKVAGGESVVRTILAVDEDNQSMTFAGDIPTRSMVQLMKANFGRLVEGASSAALEVQSQFLPDQPSPKTLLSIAISCVGRRLVLGEYIEDELEATLDGLPIGTQQVGFYSYGEISPHANGHCDFHNQTMTLTTLFES